MAKFKGKDGVIRVGSTAIGNLRSYEVSETAATTDATVMGDDDTTHEALQNSWEGSADALWDDTDTSGQGALAVGSTVALEFHPEGTGSGNRELTGNAIVTGRTVRASHDGLVEGSFTFQGTGGLTEGDQS